MKTTLYIQDDLFREAKVKAAQEGIRIKDLIEEGLRVVLSGKHPFKRARRVAFPLIQRSSQRPLVALKDIQRSQEADLEEEAAHAKSLRR